MTETQPLVRAIQIVGTLRGLAEQLGVTRAAIWQWRLPNRKVPAEYCPSIERITHGAVTCEELRPDVEWSYLRSSRKRRPAASSL